MWTGDFVTDKIALLLELNQQVIDEKKARDIATGRSGNCSPQTQLRRAIKKVVKQLDQTLIVYNEAQRLEENSRLKTPSLNHLNSGQRLQDTLLFDPMLRDLTACPVCSHLRTQTAREPCSRQPGCSCRCFGRRGRRDIRRSVVRVRMLLPRHPLSRASERWKLSGMHLAGEEWQHSGNGWAG
jgi:hypothetical protein